MKKMSFVLLMLLPVSSLFAQQQKYFRVKIYAGTDGLKKLSQKGVATDHGINENGISFTSDFSEKELGLIEASGLKYEVLINDMAAYYVNRNIGETMSDVPANPAAECAAYPRPKNFTPGSMGGFYTYNELLSVLDSMVLKFPKLITAKKIVSNNYTTTEGRPLYFVKISDHPGKNENEPKILYTALHHAREPESMAQLIYFMWYLLEHYKKDTVIHNLIDSTEMYFIPCVNPDGYIYNETTNPNGGGFWRKNRRNNSDGSFGVDLNRNYGYQWGYDDIGSSPYPASETYRGPSAFSEPEIKMIREFCYRVKFSYALNNHSYGNYLIYPYGYAPRTYTADSLLFRKQGTRLVKCNYFTKGTAIQTVGYTANGNSDDWMYGEQTEKPKIIAYTAETGDGTDGFWPKKSRIIPLAAANMDMNIALAFLTKQSFYRQSISGAVTSTGIKTTSTQVLYNSPNPCNGFTRVYYNDANQIHRDDINLIICNAAGQPVLSKKINAGEKTVLISTNSLSAGIYYYFIKEGSYQSKTLKMVVVK